MLSKSSLTYYQHFSKVAFRGYAIFKLYLYIYIFLKCKKSILYI